MTLQIIAKFDVTNEGIEKVMELVAPKGRVEVDFKRGYIIIDDFSKEKSKI